MKSEDKLAVAGVFAIALMAVVRIEGPAYRPPPPVRATAPLAAPRRPWIAPPYRWRGGPITVRPLAVRRPPPPVVRGWPRNTPGLGRVPVELLTPDPR